MFGVFEEVHLLLRGLLASAKRGARFYEHWLQFEFLLCLNSRRKICLDLVLLLLWRTPTAALR